MDTDPELGEAFHNLTPGAAEELCGEPQLGKGGGNAHLAHWRRNGAPDRTTPA
jgi:hypothetical protein